MGLNLRAEEVSRAGNAVKRERIPEIDFWRGFALIVILVDHIPWNGLDSLTPQNFGFSDAAEIFVFLSGVSVCLAYGSPLHKVGFPRLVNRCAKRAAKIYLVQIALTACSIAIPLAAAEIMRDERIALLQGLSRFLNDPVSATVGVATLTYMPNYSVILPLYIVLLLWAPVIIILASRSPALALLASLGIYVAGRGRFGGHDGDWFFNPLAWQLIFTIGVICALVWRNGPPRPNRRLVVLAVIFILGAAILSIKPIGLRAAAFAHLDLSKPDLGVIRLAHFLALAYVIATLTSFGPWAAPITRIVGSSIGRSLQSMGRSSLLFFALGAVASAGGRSLMGAANSLSASHLSLHFIGFVYVVAAIVGMFAVVHRMDRTASSRRLSTKEGPAVQTNSFRAESDPAAVLR